MTSRPDLWSTGAGPFGVPVSIKPGVALALSLAVAAMKDLGKAGEDPLINLRKISGGIQYNTRMPNADCMQVLVFDFEVGGVIPPSSGALAMVSLDCLQHHLGWDNHTWGMRKVEIDCPSDYSTIYATYQVEEGVLVRREFEVVEDRAYAASVDSH